MFHVYQALSDFSFPVLQTQTVGTCCAYVKANSPVCPVLEGL